jgi:plasmid maintenance system antidote protein VapI
MTMKNPPHPGLSVRHDCIEPLGLTITEAAEALGRDAADPQQSSQRQERHFSGYGEPP